MGCIFQNTLIGILQINSLCYLLYTTVVAVLPGRRIDKAAVRTDGGEEEGEREQHQHHHHVPH